MATLSIGELAKICDLNLETLRYYERVGLMQPPPRSESGHRQYPASAIDRLGFIRQVQGLGFTLREIKELLELKRNESERCVDVVHSIDAKIAEVEKKMSDLRSIQKALTKMKELCHGDCLIGDCPILEHLEDAGSSRPVKRARRNSRRSA